MSMLSDGTVMCNACGGEDVPDTLTGFLDLNGLRIIMDMCPACAAVAGMDVCSECQTFVPVTDVDADHVCVKCRGAA